MAPFNRLHLLLALALPLPVPGFAAGPVHLLGFVERLCAAEDYCFELRVEPEYAALAAARITVRFAGATKIYDPENFELTLAQQAIGPGSHLRLLIAPDSAAGDNQYRASFVWIGD